MLDEALKRTKSGTRPIVRSEPALEPHREAADAEPLDGPRDDSPQVTIVGIDSVELDVVDVSSLVRSPSAPEPTPEPVGMQAPSTPQPSMTVLTPRARSRDLTDRFRTTPQLAFFAGLAIVAFVTLAAVIGFFAGRISNP